MKSSFYVLITFFAIFSFSQAAAASNAWQVELDQGSFEQQREAIMKRLDDGESYAEINSGDRQSVIAILGRMSSVLEKAPDINALREQDRVQLFNDQESVNTILTRAKADSRQICRRERTIGTRFSTTSCSTVAELRRVNENSQDTMRRISDMRVPMPRPNSN